jgi:hypothetical protein
VCILEQHEHRRLRGHRAQPREQRVKRLLLLSLGTQLQGRIARARRYRKQRSEQRHRFAVMGPELRQQLLELVEPLLGRVAAREFRRMLELLYEGMQRAVGVIGGALIHESCVRYAGQTFAQAFRHP